MNDDIENGYLKQKNEVRPYRLKKQRINCIQIISSGQNNIMLKQAKTNCLQIR